MIAKMVRYTVAREQLGTVREAIAEFVDAIARHEPRTLYEAYELPEPNAFLHVMRFPDEAAEREHQRAPHTVRFAEILYPRCEVKPLFTDLTFLRSTLPE